MPVNKNLVEDPCFTSGLWKLVSEPEGLKVSLDEVHTYPGTEASLKIESQGWKEWILVYNGLMPVKPKETYRLSVYMKPGLEGRKPWAAVEPRILDKKENRIKAVKKTWIGDSGEPFTREDLGFWRGGFTAVTGIWDWRRMTGGFMVPEDGAFMQIMIRGEGPGKVWVTKVELYKGFDSLVRDVEPPQVPDYPRAVLYKRLRLGEYAGKVLRPGDLNGDGNVEFLFAQRMDLNPVKQSNVKYVALNCLTADVWSDLPVQLFDFNGDGQLEVLCCKDFKIKLLDGATGETIRETDTPDANPGECWGEGPEDGFPRILGDSITICNLTGEGLGDFTLKDRYNNLWAYDRRLRRIWSYTGKMAHYAQTYDVDNDGLDEVFTDSSVFYKNRDGRLILAVAYEDGGFYFLDAVTGEILREWHLGHGQGVNFASYRPDQPGGLAIAANTFWGGAFWFIFSLEGELLKADFMDVYGWVPVNWSGDGVELIGSPYGLYDGYGRMVVRFPDSHPGKVWVYDVCGDPRDEVIVWNESFLSIYTQSERFAGKCLFTPKRRLYNQTFYGSFISKPSWTAWSTS